MDDILSSTDEEFVLVLVLWFGLHVFLKGPMCPQTPRSHLESWPQGTPKLKRIKTQDPTDHHGWQGAKHMQTRTEVLQGR